MVGKGVPPPVDSFQMLQEEFQLVPEVIQNLHASGYTEPTPIQMQALPIMMQVSAFLLYYLMLAIII